jgi:hypothetical protein
MRRDRARICDRDEFEKAARELDKAVLGSPGVTIAVADLKSETTVKLRRGIEIVDRQNEVVDAWTVGLLGIARQGGSARLRLR